MKRIYSSNEEEFRYDCINDAAQDVWDSLSNEIVVNQTVCTVYEGKLEDTTASTYFSGAEGVIESMGELAYDNCGDFAEDWLYVETPVAEDLDQKLHAVIDEWATKHNLHPEFGVVSDVVEVKIRFFNEDGDWEFV